MEQKPSRFKQRLAAFGLAGVLLLGLGAGAWADDSTRKELAGNRDAASSVLNKAENKLEKLEEQTQKAEAQGAALQEKYDALKEQIYKMTEELGRVQERVAQLQAQVEAKEEEYRAEWESYREILAAMQKMRAGGSVAMMLQIQDLYQLLTFAHALQEMSQAEDTALISLAAQKQELETQKEELSVLEEEMFQQKAGLNGKIDQLAKQIEKQNTAISQAQAEEEAQKVAVQAAQAAFNKAADEYDAYIKEQIAQGAANNTLACGLDFQCPLDEHHGISCYFGEADGWDGSPHCGTDFISWSGTPIRAAGDGVVQAAEYSKSYGYYVLVYHGRDDAGRTFATLYAHMNGTPSVKAGQSVRKGDLVGRVGNSGNSRGYHLHLELRIDGARTDPFVYIPSR